jgi:hypothetical protein
MNGYRCFNNHDLESVSEGSTESERRNFPAAILCGRDRIHGRDIRKPLQKPGPVVNADVDVQPKRSLAAPSSNAPRVGEKVQPNLGKRNYPSRCTSVLRDPAASTSVF